MISTPQKMALEDYMFQKTLSLTINIRMDLTTTSDSTKRPASQF